MAHLRALQPQTTYLILSGFNHQHKRLIRTDGNAIRKVQISQKRSLLLRLCIECEQETVPLMLEQFVCKLRHRKLSRCFGKVDRSISPDIEVVETAKLLAVSFHGEHSYLA